MKTIIPSPKNLKKIKTAIAADGPKNFHVLADFHQALTQAFVDGKLVLSLISILRDNNYLTPDYAGKARALFNKYHPIETDPSVPQEEKKKVMREWWTTHFKLLIDSGLNKKDIETAPKGEEVGILYEGNEKIEKDDLLVIYTEERRKI